MNNPYSLMLIYLSEVVVFALLLYVFSSNNTSMFLIVSLSAFAIIYSIMLAKLVCLGIKIQPQIKNYLVTIPIFFFVFLLFI